MAKGEGAPPKEFFSCFSSEWEELLLQTNFVAVRTSLGHPSEKKAFQIRPTVLALKLHTGKVLQGGTSIQVVLGLAPKFASEIHFRAPNSASNNPPEGLKTFCSLLCGSKYTLVHLSLLATFQISSATSNALPSASFSA